MLSIDIETIENIDWKKLGPGYHRKDGMILCVGVYDGKNYDCFMPDDIRLREQLCRDEPKIFHNSVYDTSWLVHGYGYTINSVLHDTMTRAVLIDEREDHYDLDSCCKRFGVEGKNKEDTLDKWFEEYKKLYSLRGTIWDNLDIVWSTDAGKEAIIKYNKQDCIATYNLFMAQEPYMDLHREAYQLECDLQPVILMLNGNGIRVDEIGRDRFAIEIRNKIKEVETELNYKYNITSTIVRSPKQLTNAMLNLGIKSPLLTDKGAQSWSAAALDELDHPVAELILNFKKLDVLLGHFLEGSLNRGLVNGRVHSVFSPNKRDDGGTITGRLASAKINLQQIPAREVSAEGIKSYGKELRSLFLPEQGCLLGALDYSSIEMFGLAHEAIGINSGAFRQQAIEGKDFHKMAMELSGITNRDYAKRLNFTIIYGAGPNGIFKKNKKVFKTIEFTREIYNKYHVGMPFVKTTMEAIQNEALTVGYVRSIGGRVHHKPKPYYENGKWNTGLYKMTNYKIQGGCADTLKKGLVDAYNAGCFNVLKLNATVHDENVVSIPFTKEGFEATAELQRCMENAYKDRWTVPIRTSCEIGDTWGFWDTKVWDDYKVNGFNDKYKELVVV